MCISKGLNDCLRVSRQTKSDDITEGLEFSLEGSLVGLEREVGNEDSVRLGGLLVAVSLGAVLAGSGIGAGGGVVDVERAAVQVLAIHSLESVLGGGSFLIFNISETIEILGY